MSWSWEQEDSASVLTTPMSYCQVCRRYISNTERHDSAPCSATHPTAHYRDKA